MTAAMVFPIVPECVTTQQTAHEFGDPLGATEHQEVSVITHQNPGKDSRFRVLRDLSEAREEVLVVFILTKDGLSFGSPDYHVVQGSRGI
jgi:hypothetical protein